MNNEEPAMPDNSATNRLSKIRDIFGQLQENDERIMILQSEAFDKYGEAGEDTAVDLLTDQPELADSKEEFWQQIEAKLGD